MSTEIDPGIPGLSRFEPIGRGGFSTVYRAWEEEFSRQVAVKILHRLDDGAEHRFDRERSLMGRTSGHPNVITPIRSGRTADGLPFLVMQYLEGGSLQDLVNRGEVLPWTEAVALVRPVAEALGHSHEAGILHKDVKPANILLAANGSPSLTDFGIATVLGSTVTETAFTFAHTPPEAFLGGADDRDERSDLYSLASTLYTIVAGRSPFAAVDEDDSSQLAWLHRVANNPVEPTGLDDRLDRFLTRALAKDPGERPRDAADFVAALDSLLEPEPEPERRLLLPDVPAPPVEPGVAAPPLHRVEPLDPAGPPDRASSDRVVTERGSTMLVVLAIGTLLVVGAGTLVGLRAAGIVGSTVTVDDDAGAVTEDDPNGPASSAATAEGGERDPTAEQGTEGDADGGPVASDGVGQGATRSAEAQQAIILLQDPDGQAQLLITDRILPTERSGGTGFTAADCEAQLGQIDAALGGPDLTVVRDELARWPAGAPEGYRDPAGRDRGFRERLDAFADQARTGYQRCRDRADITPIGARVLGGWASLQSFLCVAGAADRVVLGDGTGVACPASDELALCTDILSPLLDDFFRAFPDLRPDPAEACRAAIADDPDALDALSGAT